MTDPGDRPGYGRFGAASPGLRPERQSLEELLTARKAPPARRGRALLVAACVVAVLVVGGAGYLAGRLTAPGPPTLTKILVTDTALPEGARLSAADLSAVTVGDGISAPAGSLRPSAAASVTGLATTVALPSGTILTRSLLAPLRAVALPARALVGLALHPGQLPVGGLTPGEQVLIVLVPSSTSAPASPLVTTTVWDVQGSAAAGLVTATVIVPVADATQLAGYAARGEVALVVTAGASHAIAVRPASTRPSTKPHSKPSSKPKPSHSS